MNHKFDLRYLGPSGSSDRRQHAGHTHIAPCAFLGRAMIHENVCTGRRILNRLCYRLGLRLGISFNYNRNLVARPDRSQNTRYFNGYKYETFRTLHPAVAWQEKAEDIRTLVDSFTAPALAAALRDRETALHACAHLLEQASQ